MKSKNKYDTIEIVCMLLGCSFLNDRDKEDVHSIIEDIRSDKRIDSVIWKMSRLLHLRELQRHLKYFDENRYRTDKNPTWLPESERQTYLDRKVAETKRHYEQRLERRQSELQKVEEIVGQIKLILDPEYIISDIMEEKMEGGPIRTREAGDG